MGCASLVTVQSTSGATFITLDFLIRRIRLAIHFGTDGWRAVIAEDFTFDNVRLVAQALADVVDERSEDKRVAIGYDYRFLSEDFARAVAEVLAGNGVTTYLSPSA